MPCLYKHYTCGSPSPDLRLPRRPVYAVAVDSEEHAANMRAMIDDFRIVPAGHCGSGSMRNLIYHYCGLDLPEGVVFGLGAGLDAVYFEYPDAAPPFMAFGRGSTMEADIARTLGIDYSEQMEPDNDKAWEDVKAEILAGRPTMLSGDIFYLDYREYTVHFPAHRFVLLGFDEEAGEVYIADRVNDYPETCSMQALVQSRNPPVGISTYNQWGKFQSGEVRHSLTEAAARALRMTVERMQGADTSQRELMAAAVGQGRCETGLAGLAALCDALDGWPGLEDAAERLVYLDNAIVKFGTGGGFFRNHFAVFLAWARERDSALVSADDVALAVRAAERWNALSPALRQLAASPGNEAAWQDVSGRLRSILDDETVLIEQLGTRLQQAA